ncbi:MAG TPA: CpaF family protein [Armatimonadota bacterium]|jgi:pilus assembly protein CpaF
MADLYEEREFGGLTHTEEPSGDFLTPTEISSLKSTVHARLMDEVESSHLQAMDDEALMHHVTAVTARLINERHLALPSRVVEMLRKEVLYELRGHGPIQPLLDDPSVSEVMVNGSDSVYIERYGRLEKSDVRFQDDNHVRRIIERIVAPLGRRIDESSPMVDARLKDGSRVNAIIPPLALNGPVLTIRKFSRKPFSSQDLVRMGTYNESMERFLQAAVGARLNIIVSGGTGSGKTTTLNVLTSFIPENERIVTIEDAAELQPQQEHVVALESRPANIEGKGEITIRQLVRNSLRMRPDRIVVGEVRGGEALDMLQAMNTGHDGSISTAHANAPRDTLARLETMVLMSGTTLPARSIREQICSAVHLIVHQARMRDGTRKITNVTELVGMDGDVIVLQDIFTFDQSGMDADGNVRGQHAATGIRPRCIDKIQVEGFSLPTGIFGS